MRQIKFRFFNIDDGSFYDSIVLRQRNEKGKIEVGVHVMDIGDGRNAPKGWYLTDAGWCTKDIETKYVQQFTGLQDKNGTDIYEGDIAKDKFTKYEIVWQRFTYALQDIHTKEIFNFPHFTELEAIGNIYQNPELINLPI